MGRSSAWNAEETILLAKAYIAASEDKSETNGIEKKKNVMWTDVLKEYELRAPAEGSATVGRFHNRGLKAIKSRFLDTIQPDVLGFNKALLTIFRSKPTGCTNQEKINMAVALHCGKQDRSSRV